LKMINADLTFAATKNREGEPYGYR